MTQGGRKAIFFTTAKPDPKRVREIEAKAGPVIVAGRKRVTGKLLKQRIQELGYSTVYSGAGPQVLHLLLEGGVLDRLYLTFANRILGGENFDTFVKGDLIKPPAEFKTDTIIFDPFGLDGLGQMFVSYESSEMTPTQFLTSLRSEKHYANQIIHLEHLAAADGEICAPGQAAESGAGRGAPQGQD